MDVADLLKRLVKYRFLEQKNDTYRFKYGYMYYYFAGSYITQKLPPEMRPEVIKEVFLNINKDLNYNIALFLAYSLSIEFEILPVIKNLEDELLANYNDFKYEKLRDVIEKWSGNIEENDIKKQTTRVMENIKGLLESENLTMANIIKTTCFLTDMANFAAFNEVYANYFPENPPARSTVAIKALPKDALVEVEIIAVIS